MVDRRKQTSFPRPWRRPTEDGFTLVELLVVIIIIGILVVAGVASYLSFRDRAQDTGAQADIRAILPSIQSYFGDNNTYVGMTIAGLKSTYDQGINTAKYVLPAADLSATSFCVQSAGSKTWRKNGPSASLENVACP